MLFGHGFMGGGLGGFGFLGLLLQIFLVVIVVRFLFRFFAARRSPAMRKASLTMALTSSGASDSWRTRQPGRQ